MKILLLSSLIPKEISKDIINNSEAANNFIWGIINELEKSNDIEIYSYIGYKLKNDVLLKEAMADTNITYLIKQEWGIFKSFIKYYKAIFAFIKNNDLVLMYNLIYINVFVLYIAKILGKKVAIIIADHTMASEQPDWKRKLLSRISEHQYKKMDKRIILSFSLYKKYSNLKTIWLPGGIRNSLYSDFSYAEKTDKLNIMYCGMLNNVTGVDLLLDFIEKHENEIISEKYCFTITGKGELEDRISSANISNLIFKGFLPEDVLLSEMKNANIFINPRNMNLEQNHNNFPSKVMEYLATGRIVISTRFPGHELFNENITFYENDNELKNILLNIYEQYDLINKEAFCSNRNFAQKFSWNKQVEKIEELLKI